MIVLTDNAKRRLEQVAQWLEQGAPHACGMDGFNIETFRQYSPECGTTCCIAGALVAFEDGHTHGSYDIVRIMQLLDIGTNHTNFFEMKTLFYDGIRSNCSAQPPETARVIRHLIATGEIRWEHEDDD